LWSAGALACGFLILQNCLPLKNINSGRVERRRPRLRVLILQNCLPSEKHQQRACGAQALACGFSHFAKLPASEKHQQRACGAQAPSPAVFSFCKTDCLLKNINSGLVERRRPRLRFSHFAKLPAF
jgi:hypothetical protein